MENAPTTSSVTTNMNAMIGPRNPVDAWIMERFVKRECVVIIPTSRDSKKCGCGRYLAQHYYFEEENDAVKDGASTKWSITRCTTTLPTDAFGTLTFHGVLGLNKARYIRLDFSSDPVDIWHLLVDVWCLEPPKLVITVHGGGNDFDLSPSILRAFRKGLLKAARTTSVWIITSGIRLGIVRHVTAALSEAVGRNKLKHVNVIGIAPWGLVRRADDLIGVNQNFPYYPAASSTSTTSISSFSAAAKSSRYVSLCEGHTSFLLVDNGTSGRPGAEAFLRRRFEDFLRQQPLLSGAGTNGPGPGPYRIGRLMPMVCLVANGGRSAIHSVMSYVSTTPSVPVVVCSGTGRAADLIAYAYRNMDEANGEFEPGIRQRLLDQIRQSLQVNEAEAIRLLKSIILVIRRRNLLTIYGSGTGLSSTSRRQSENPIDEHDHTDHHHSVPSSTGPGHHASTDGPSSSLSADSHSRIITGHDDELDFAMLNALLKGQNMSAVDKLNLLLIWNREDMAREIFEKGGHEWPSGSLDQAMMNALIYDRVDFVKLLLSHGMDMERFLTMTRLEELYNSDKGPSNTLRFVLQDVVKDVGPYYKYKLPHVGLIIDKLMGYGFRSNYCRQEFRKRYKAQQSQRRTSIREPPLFTTTGNNYSRQGSVGDKTTLRTRLMTMASTGHAGKTPPHFPYPFHDLFLWAVLTNRQEMALCFWQHGEELLARALLAYKLYKSLAQEAEEDYLEVEICQQLKKNANEFRQLAYELLEQCYQIDDDLTLQLLTYELRQWSKWNCISLAAVATYKKFVAHQCCQMLLADLWLGGLRIRKNANLKVVVGVVVPPTILALHFKSKEELLLQAQTAEEFEENRHIAKGGTNAASSGDGTSSSSTSDSSSSERDDSDEEADPRGASKRRRGDKRRKQSRVEQKDEESGGILQPISHKQHHEAHKRTKERQGSENPHVEFRLSDRGQCIPSMTSPAVPSPTAEESTAASSPDINFSARPSVALEMMQGYGSPSSYRCAVGGKTDSSIVVDSGVHDCQRSPEEHDHQSNAQSASLPVAPSVPQYSSMTLKARPTSFALGTTRKLHSMVALKKQTPSLGVPRLSPIKQHQQLSIKKKMQEFYSAPIATFWAFTIGYLIFLSAFTYIVLVKTPLEPSWPEYYVMAFIFTFGIDHGRMILVQEPKNFLSKLRVFCHHVWNVCTLLACIMFFLAVFFRVSPETKSIGRVMYCVNIVFWYMRMLHLLTVSSKLGPFINMYGKMVLKMVLLINILFVVLASFGVFRQSITEPNRDWSWELLRNIVYKPYFMLYGELYAEEIDKCGDEGSRISNETGVPIEVNCVPGFWLTPLFMTIYLLLSIVVFLNMMIAAFNYVFMEVNSQAQEIWKFQRYEQVIEYEQQPFMPPPFVMFAHIYWLGKYLYMRMWKRQKRYRFEHSLKLFLSSSEISKLHDFERECMEEMLAKKRDLKAASTEERLRYMTDRMDHLSSRLDDLHDRTNNNLFTLTMLEQKITGGGVIAGPPPHQPRILPTQSSMPLYADHPTQLQSPSQRTRSDSTAPVQSMALPLANVATFPGNITHAVTPRMSVGDIGTRSATDEGHSSHPHFDWRVTSPTTRGSETDRPSDPSSGAGAATVARHLLGIDTPCTISRSGSFSRTQTWASGLGEAASCEDLSQMHYQAGGEGGAVEFISGSDGYDPEEEEDEEQKK